MSTDPVIVEEERAGPCVFAIAWIPKVKINQRLPEGFRKHRKWFSWRGMLTTGNEHPPRHFAGVDDFQAFIDKKDFRGILGFRDIKIRPPRAGEISHVGTLTRIRIAGYTPLKIALNRNWPWVRFGYHSQGEEAAILTKVSGPGMDFISEGADLEFRVGKGLNWAHKILTGHRLWFASMGVQYQLEFDGHCYAEISSTNIPNVTVYFDWKAVEDFTIQNITVEQVEDFLTADKRKQPPERADRFSVSGKTGEEPAIGHPPLESDQWFTREPAP